MPKEEGSKNKTGWQQQDGGVCVFVSGESPRLGVKPWSSLLL